MNNPIKLMGVMLAAAVSAVVLTAGGASAQARNQDELKSATREASNYLNGKIPKGSKIVVLNIQSNSPELSDYIIDELIANAVNDRFFTVVSRKQLDAIRNEQKFQMSGEVDDKDALAIGKLFGAQTIVSGVVGTLGTGWSLRINALSVQTAQVQGQYNMNIASSQIISSLMGSGGYSTPRAAPTASTASAASAASSVPAPLLKGTAVPGSSLTEKLAWLQRGADSHNTYILEVNEDENIASQTLEFQNIINVTIALRGIGVNRNVSLGSNGIMFTIRPNVTFVLENNITIRGHNQNNNSLVHLDGGTFIMNTGSNITGNSNSRNGTYGHGIYVEGGTFTMNGGAISDNGTNSGSNSRGVDGGGGGGGVYVRNGTFTMNGGIISGNACNLGGGVFVGHGNGTFTQTGGAIRGNTARSYGGGVYIAGGTFAMRGGNIVKNTAVSGGGGVCSYGGVFTKTGGTITGYKSDANNGNAVIDGTPLPRSGHAVSVIGFRSGGMVSTVRKETTAGTTVNLSYSSNRHPSESGAWDQ